MLLAVDVQNRIARYLPPIKEAIQAYLKNNTELPIWEPSGAPPNFVEHIRSLKIPTLPSSPRFPSLLLHNLGKPSHDPELVHRVQRLFAKTVTRR